MDKNTDLFKGVVKKLRRVINRSDLEFYGRRRSSDELEDLSESSSTSSLVPSGARIPSYPSTCSNSSAGSSSPEEPIKTPDNDSCNNWSDLKEILNTIPPTTYATNPVEHSRKKISKKHSKIERENLEPSSTQSSDSSEPNAEKSQSLEYCKDVGAHTYQKLDLKRKLGQDDRDLSTRRLRRCNSMEDSSRKILCETASNRRKYREKRLRSHSSRSVSDIENQHNTSNTTAKRKNNTCESLESGKKVRKLSQK